MNRVKHVNSPAEDSPSSNHRREQGDLTDPRQLFTEHYVQYTRSTDPGLHQHHAWMIGYDLSDDHGVAPMLVLLHLLQHCLRHFRCDHGKQLTLVGDVERVQPKHFANAFYRVADGNRILAQNHAHPGALCDLVQRGGCAAARRVPQTMNELSPACLRRAQHSGHQAVQEAQSLAIAPSNSRPSRCDMMAMPWSP